MNKESHVIKSFPIDSEKYKRDPEAEEIEQKALDQLVAAAPWDDFVQDRLLKVDLTAEAHPGAWHAKGAALAPAILSEGLPVAVETATRMIYDKLGLEREIALHKAMSERFVGKVDGYAWEDLVAVATKATVAVPEVLGTIFADAKKAIKDADGISVATAYVWGEGLLIPKAAKATIKRYSGPVEGASTRDGWVVSARVDAEGQRWLFVGTYDTAIEVSA